MAMAARELRPRAWARHAFVAAILVGVVVTVAAGIGGWCQSPDNAGWGDAIYKALLAFFGDGVYFNLEGQGRVWLEIARWSGLATTIIAGSWAIFEFARTSNIRWMARRGRRVVLIGSHPIVERAADFPAIASRRRLHLGADGLARFGRLVTLPWDDADRKPEIIRRHFKKSVRHILIAEADDFETLRLARAVDGAAGETGPEVTITALIQDKRLDTEPSAGSSRMRILSIPRLAMRAAHRRHPPYFDADGALRPRYRALIIGAGPVAEAVMRDLCINCLVTPDDRPEITLLDEAGQSFVRDLRLCVPELDETVQQLSLASCLDQCPAGAFDAVYLCRTSPTQTLADRHAITHFLAERDSLAARIFVWLPQSLASGDAVAFGDWDEILNETDFDAAEPDRQARALHARYLSLPTTVEFLRGERPNATEWRALSPGSRDANRAVYDHLPAKLAAAGFDARKLALADDGMLPQLPPAAMLVADAAALERLAELEHARWNAERRWQGWRYQSARDNARRHHPLLVAYSALSEKDKEYDRDQTALLNGVLKAPDMKPRRRG